MAQQSSKLQFTLEIKSQGGPPVAFDLKCQNRALDAGFGVKPRTIGALIKDGHGGKLYPECAGG